jgi:hypothetical protein
VFRKIGQIVFPVNFSYGTVYNNFGMSKPADVILLKKRAVSVREGLRYLEDM